MNCYSLQLLTKVEHLQIQIDSQNGKALGYHPWNLGKALELAKTWAVTLDRSSYLLLEPFGAREEWDNLKYIFYFRRHYLRIRKLRRSAECRDVSFQSFPEAMSADRADVISAFTAAIEVFGAYGYGPPGAGFGPNRAHEASYVPQFVEDGVAPPSM